MNDPFSADSPRSSQRTSVYSTANSTRHMLADFKGGDRLSVPGYAGLSRAGTPAGSTTALSLSVNYIPTKFSGNLTNRAGNAGLEAPKNGGGLAAFRANEDRIGGKGLRWTKFKWVLFFANILLTIYSFGSLIMCLLVWFDVFEHSEIVRLANRPELIVSTLAATVGILTAVLGWAGILLNNRMFLAIYCLLTWVTFGLLVTPGYMTYRHRTYNLEGKINAQWSRFLDPFSRQRIQSQLHCCGYFSPYVEATVSQTCYARSILPGCKLPYMEYQRGTLSIFFTIAFAIVPAHVFVMVVALLCSNHVTYRFGKGMMPEAYRLNMDSLAVIMDQYAAQLAEQYGPEVADQVMERSKSNMRLNQRS